MNETMTYDELICRLKKADDPLFGGSLAYIEIEEALALLIKLLAIKAGKPSPQQGSYRKISLIAEETSRQSHIMIEEDGRIFASIREASSAEAKDKIIADVFPKSRAFIENLFTVNAYVAGLINDTGSSLKYDFRMIEETLKAAGSNLIHILKYEIGKMSDGERKETFRAIAEGLVI